MVLRTRWLVHVQVPHEDLFRSFIRGLAEALGETCGPVARPGGGAFRAGRGQAMGVCVQASHLPNRQVLQKLENVFRLPEGLSLVVIVKARQQQGVLATWLEQQLREWQEVREELGFVHHKQDRVGRTQRRPGGRKQLLCRLCWKLQPSSGSNARRGSCPARVQPALQAKHRRKAGTQQGRASEQGSGFSGSHGPCKQCHTSVARGAHAEWSVQRSQVAQSDPLWSGKSCNFRRNTVRH